MSTNRACSKGGKSSEEAHISIIKPTLACKVIQIWKYGLYQLWVQQSVPGMVGKLEWHSISLCDWNESTVVDCYTSSNNSCTTLLKNCDVYIH